MQSFDPDISRSNSKRIEYGCIDGIYQFRAEDNPDIRASAVKNNPLCGIIFSDFVRLIFVVGIDWHLYLRRITVLFFISIFNSFLSICESIYMKLFLSKELEIASRDHQVKIIRINSGYENLIHFILISKGNFSRIPYLCWVSIAQAQLYFIRY